MIELEEHEAKKVVDTVFDVLLSNNGKRFSDVRRYYLNDDRKRFRIIMPRGFNFFCSYGVIEEKVFIDLFFVVNKEKLGEKIYCYLSNFDSLDERGSIDVAIERLCNLAELFVDSFERRDNESLDESLKRLSDIGGV